MANKAIVGEKVGMTQVWDDANRVVPVTVVSVRPCRVVQVKTPSSDGYGALQVTYGTRPARKGAERVTTLNLEVVQADPEREIVLVKGSVPGPRGGLVLIRNAVKGGA
jgi:ribosomal protein L3